MARLTERRYITVDGAKAEMTSFNVEQSGETHWPLGPSYEPDPEWTHVDGKGHVHGAVVVDGTVHWPTLKTKTTYYWCHDCHEDHAVTVEQCRRCKEAIEPGRRVVAGSGGPVYIPGLISMTVAFKWPAGAIEPGAGECYEVVIDGKRYRASTMAYTGSSTDPMVTIDANLVPWE